MQNDATVLLLVSFTSRFCVIGMLGPCFPCYRKAIAAKQTVTGQRGGSATEERGTDFHFPSILQRDRDAGVLR